VPRDAERRRARLAAAEQVPSVLVGIADGDDLFEELVDLGRHARALGDPEPAVGPGDRQLLRARGERAQAVEEIVRRRERGLTGAGLAIVLIERRQPRSETRGDAVTSGIVGRRVDAASSAELVLGRRYPPETFPERGQRAVAQKRLGHAHQITSISDW